MYCQLNRCSAGRWATSRLSATVIDRAAAAVHAELPSRCNGIGIFGWTKHAAVCCCLSHPHDINPTAHDHTIRQAVGCTRVVCNCSSCVTAAHTRRLVFSLHGACTELRRRRRRRAHVLICARLWVVLSLCVCLCCRKRWNKAAEQKGCPAQLFLHHRHCHISNSSIKGSLSLLKSVIRHPIL